MKAKTKNKSKVMLCIEGFDISNFEASLEQFPGKKAFINDTVESARMKFKKVLSELNVLI